MRRRGFTLLELLVVIVIVGILVALLLPAIQFLALPATIEEIQQLDLPRQVAEVLNRRAPFPQDEETGGRGNEENRT